MVVRARRLSPRPGTMIGVLQCVSVCLSVCPFAYLRNDTPERHQIFLVDVLFWRIVVIDVFPVFWMTSVKRHNTE